MSDDHSARLSLPFLSAGQAQKEVMHNEALQALDALVQPVVLSADLATPPGSPAEGACWIVASAAVGAWADHAGAIAQWTAAGWRFAVPSAGWRCHVVDRSAAMVHNGSAWQQDVVRADGLYIEGVKVIGARSGAIADATGGTVVDSQARLVISEILTLLRGHGLLAS